MKNNKEDKQEYINFSMDEIDEKARDIAVNWVENFKPHGAAVPEIAQKYKLANDIMNFAVYYAKRNHENKQD